VVPVLPDEQTQRALRQHEHDPHQDVGDGELPVNPGRRGEAPSGNHQFLQ